VGRGVGVAPVSARVATAISTADTSAVALDHLDATMYCLLLLAESGKGGAARVAPTGQEELCVAIAHLRGQQESFSDWRMRREEKASGRWRRG